jgi:isoquinoline 1-oxidoreductase beta subunit
VIDEAAHIAGQDPLAYRKALLVDQPRYLAILDKLEAMSGWSRPLPEGWARGIAIHESFGTIVGEVVEVAVEDRRVEVKRVYCVADPGFAMSPDGYVAQMESGIIYGLSAAISGQIEIQNGAAVQSNFHDYPVVRMSSSPEIKVAIINSDGPVGGAGEPGTPPIAPALTNAIFAATGRRIRELPIAKAGFTV